MGLLLMNTAAVLATEETEAEPVFDTAGVEATDWVIAVVILVVGIAISVILRRALVALLNRGTTGETMSELLVGRLAQVIVIAVALIYSLNVLDVRIGPLVGALGIGGIALALALQETLKNLLAGVILHAQRPLRLGEEVVTGDMQGTVVDITSRAVTIRSNSGRILFVPNSLVLDREIVNLVRHGTRRSTLVVGVAYDTDLPTAQRVIREAASTAEGVLPDPPVRVLAMEFADSSVNFDIDFWHEPEETARRESASAVMMAVHQGLRDAGITIPFPQRTLWSGHTDDSKPA